MQSVSGAGPGKVATAKQGVCAVWGQGIILQLVVVVASAGLCTGTGASDS